MAGTTRDLDFRVITFGAIVFSLLLAIVVLGAEAWFRWELARQQARLVEQYGTNRDLAELDAQQAERLSGKPEGTLAIEEAMRRVAAQ